MRRRLLAVALGTTVGLGATELALRLINAALHPTIYLLDEQLGWRHAPDVCRRLRDERGREVTFATDADGLRVDPAAGPAPASADARTVLFVGDSFTQGSQVEHAETFVARVGEALPNVRTLNAGVGGYSTLQVSLALQSQLPRHRPQLVVLTVFDNDFADNLMPYFSGLGPRPFVAVDGAFASLRLGVDPTPFLPFLQPAPAAFWLYTHSALYRAVHKNLFLPRHGDRLARLEQEARRALPEDDERVAMAVLLRQLGAAVRGAGAQLLVAAMPTRQQVARGASPWQKWLAEHCATHEIPFVALLPALREAGAERCYYEVDIHLTREGHEAVTAAMAPAIEAALATPR
ncbi:MAG: SGNH/GDSL hydrolase family protein [Planctomycetota bacterium]